MFEALYRAIEKAITDALPGAEVHIHDPMNDGAHLQALVIAEQFRGIPLVKQHKMVMSAVANLMEARVHSLGLKTFTPEKWEVEKKDYIM